MQHKAHAQREGYTVASRENATASLLSPMQCDGPTLVVSGQPNCALRSSRRVVSYVFVVVAVVVVISVVDIFTTATTVQCQSFSRPRVFSCFV
jgi:hypothetical protein